MNTSIERAVQIVGSQSEVARQVGVKPQSVQQWVSSGRVPPHWCLTLERITNKQITRYDLRPDVFGEKAPAA